MTTRRYIAVPAGIALVSGALLSGCSSHSDSPPVPTTAATDSNGNNARLVVPSDLVGKNAQLADDELRKLGFLNIRYGAEGVAMPPANVLNLADWNVSKVEPAGGSPAQSNDHIVVTVAKK
jgi:hypothetical protein